MGGGRRNAAPGRPSHAARVDGKVTQADDSPMRWILSLALCLCALSAQAKDYASKMQFSLFQPCKGSASFCGPRVLASGVFDEGATDRLAALVGQLGYSPTIVFDSPGGSLVAGVQMGEYIRAKGLDTAMETAYTQEEAEAPETVLSADPICFSACAYAFMGGVSRSIAEGSRIGVHQFRGNQTGNVEATAQATVAWLSQYMKRMGVDRDILDVAGLTESGGMLEVSLAEAQAYNLDNMRPPLAAWELKATDGGDLILGVRQQKAGADARTLIAMVSSADPSILRMVVGFDNVSEARQTGDTEAYRYANDAELCSDNLCAPLEVVAPWKQGADSLELTVTYAVRTSQLRELLADGGELRFSSGFAKSAAIDPSVTLGNAGLSSGLNALSRQ